MYAETKVNHESPQNIRMTGRVFPSYQKGFHCNAIFRSFTPQCPNYYYYYYYYFPAWGFCTGLSLREDRNCLGKY
jgi:hypothetical protein